MKNKFGIKSVTLNGVGPIERFEFDGLGDINLIIGHNGSGKTALLKTLYATLCAIEKRQGERYRNTAVEFLLSQKLMDTFDVRELRQIVRKGNGGKAQVMVEDYWGEKIAYSFGINTQKQILSANLSCSFDRKRNRSLFLPAKEVLSIRDAVISSREKEDMYGFDDTYYDLAKALTPSYKGRNYLAFADARKALAASINGRIEFDDSKKRWMFTDNKRQVHEIAMTSEGVKKLAVLDALLGNHMLGTNSVVFVDEPESALHPELISNYLDIIFALANSGVQFFIASHSYFVVKKLYLLAQQHQCSIPVFSFGHNGMLSGDLKDELPQNPIMDESIRLYKEEMGL